MQAAVATRLWCVGPAGTRCERGVRRSATLEKEEEGAGHWGREYIGLLPTHDFLQLKPEQCNGARKIHSIEVIVCGVRGTRSSERGSGVTASPEEGKGKAAGRHGGLMECHSILAPRERKDNNHRSPPSSRLPFPVEAEGAAPTRRRLLGYSCQPGMHRGMHAPLCCQLTSQGPRALVQTRALMHSWLATGLRDIVQGAGRPLPIQYPLAPRPAIFPTPLHPIHSLPRPLPRSSMRVHTSGFGPYTTSCRHSDWLSWTHASPHPRQVC